MVKVNTLKLDLVAYSYNALKKTHQCYFRQFKIEEYFTKSLVCTFQNLKVNKLEEGSAAALPDERILKIPGTL